MNGAIPSRISNTLLTTRQGIWCRSRHRIWAASIILQRQLSIVKKKGIGAYQGGTCNETDRSAQVCVNVAMATRPDQILAKPGMGVDEGYMIVYNEMQRILACMKAKMHKKKLR